MTSDSSGEARPKEFPELRGFSRRQFQGDGWSGATRDPERPYSSASYCAQYGITMEQAEWIRGRYGRHIEIELAIFRLRRGGEEAV